MERYFESVNCKNIKEIVYNSAKKFAENVAFVIKHKNEKKEVAVDEIRKKFGTDSILRASVIDGELGLYKSKKNKQSDKK